MTIRQGPQVDRSADARRAWRSLPAQIFIGGAILGFTAFSTILAATIGYYDGMTSTIGWTIMSVVVAAASLLIMVVVGLPLRISGRIRTWWFDHAYVAYIGTALGFVLLGVAWFVGSAGTVTVTDEYGFEFTSRVPDGWVLGAGWTLLAFSVAHCWLPRRRTPSDE